jgi:hypothetical protein
LSAMADSAAPIANTPPQQDRITFFTADTLSLFLELARTSPIRSHCAGNWLAMKGHFRRDFLLSLKNLNGHRAGESTRAGAAPGNEAQSLGILINSTSGDLFPELSEYGRTLSLHVESSRWPKWYGPARAWAVGTTLEAV